MNRFGALKLVEPPAFYSRELEMPDDVPGNEMSHSMHYSVQLPKSITPCLAAHFISKFSKKGQVVLDPFCSSGNVALESVLLGRISKASDIDELAYEITSAKVNPADITEVTLKLSTINLKRPVDLENFRQIFSAYYDIDTYRELLNLRDYLLSDNGSRKDKAASFISLLTMSLLHGNNAGYLSTYSHPQIALSPAEQQKINFQRAQTPDYRPLHPRILRKAAFVLREGIPSVLYSNMQYNSCVRADARNLSYLGSASVDLIITRPPSVKLSGKSEHLDSQWLKNWFLGRTDSKPEQIKSQQVDFTDMESWKDFQNESLLEMARVLRPGGRAVLEFSAIKAGNEIIYPDALISDLIDESLQKYWEAEGVYIQKSKISKVRNEQKSENPFMNKNGRSLVLRRR